MRHLAFFDRKTPESFSDALMAARGRGVHKLLVVGNGDFNAELSAIAAQGLASVHCSQTSLELLGKGSEGELVFVADDNEAAVRRYLLQCFDWHGEVVAPVTSAHSSMKTLFLLSIPKAGTHMVIKLLELMGLPRSSDQDPRPGSWTTVPGYSYHAPCRDFLATDWNSPLGRSLLFRSPALFVYRHPLDIVASELSWFKQPEHAFSGYLNAFEDDDERISRLLLDETVMGSLRDRINRYVGWIAFQNVIPISYEILVGAEGGGSDSLQEQAIWALQLKLQLPGSPSRLAEGLYDRNSRTFSTGKIGKHRELFQDAHYMAARSLRQDFMEVLGYSYESLQSSRAIEFLRRPLEIKSLSLGQLREPMLVREGVVGHNIVEIAGRYYAVPHGVVLDNDGASADWIATNPGHVSMQAACEDAIASFREVEQDEFETTVRLVEEGFYGFNIVRRFGRWLGLVQAIGPVDLAAIDEKWIDERIEKHECITGSNLREVKESIYWLALKPNQTSSLNTFKSEKHS